MERLPANSDPGSIERHGAPVAPIRMDAMDIKNPAAAKSVSERKAEALREFMSRIKEL